MFGIDVAHPTLSSLESTGLLQGGCSIGESLLVEPLIDGAEVPRRIIGQTVVCTGRV